MRRNAFMTLIAVLLAAAAAGAVFLYMQKVRDRSVEVETVDVVVSTTEIPAGQSLDPLIDEGAFVTRAVARDDLVDGVITDVYQLQGQRTAYPIVAGEQIPAARIAGPLQAGGGTLGIPDAMQAATITLESQRIVGGQIHEGDHVEVFGTFTAAQGAATTRVIIADALVLAVTNPSEDGTGDGHSATLAVTPEQASLLIFTQAQGRVWLTLLPPNQAGVELPPTNLRAIR